MLRQLNLDGDAQADLKVHGGEHMAVYVYPYEHYAYWTGQLQRDDFNYGQFGENFTVEGLLEDEVGIGDVYRVGGALVEVTQPRVPCFKLEHKMALHGFVKRFMQAERTGFYLRVLETGDVAAGDTITRVKQGEMSVRQIFRLLYFDQGNTAEIAKAQSLPALAQTWRAAFANLLADSPG
jgi:MOSC domain-containing protein YiiM